MSSPSEKQKPPAIDLSHHISALSAARKPSPLKGLQKYIGRTDMVSLAGGMPDPSYFPFSCISVDALIPGVSLHPPPPAPGPPSLFQWLWSFFAPGTSPEKTQRFSVPKYPARPDDINLARALQYSDARGLQQLQTFLHDFTAQIHQPAYSDWGTLVTCGNTDGIYKSLLTLLNPGAALLVEEWTYPSMLATAQPMGVRPVPIPVDRAGLSAAALERVLATWDDAAEGVKRPHVLYTVPIGQNPTGATMGLERKKAVYAVCVKYDVVIIEDDPYFFLQEGPWRPKSERAAARVGVEEEDTRRFVGSLAPSFLRVDYEGRVVRLDSFSKIMAPGARLGWITTSPVILERLERQAETSTQAACGFGQALITQLITAHWTLPRFVRWLADIRAQYTARRDFFVDAVIDAFDVRLAAVDGVEEFGAGEVYTAYLRTREKDAVREKDTMPLFSFVPPSSGMFVWLKFHVRGVRPRPRDGKDKDTGLPHTPEQTLWEELADEGLLIVPGWFFSPGTEGESAGGEVEVRYRVAFSMGTPEDLKRGVGILKKVMERYAN